MALFYILLALLCPKAAFGTNSGLMGTRCGEVFEEAAPLSPAEEAHLVRVQAAIVEVYPGASLIGRGGMNFLFSTPVPTGRVVIRAPRLYNVREARANFSREAAYLRNIASPNLVQLVSHHERDGIPFIVMNQLRGGTLEERIPTLGANGSAPDTLRFMSQVLAGVRDMHEAGYAHRDIKPNNIMFTELARHPASRPVLIDLEFATRLTERRPTRIGADIFLTDAALAGANVTPAEADLFALRITLQMMAAGRTDLQDPTIATYTRVRTSAAGRPHRHLIFSPYSLPPPAGEASRTTGHAILSTLSWHPWATVAELSTAMAAAERAMAPGSTYDFYRDFYGPDVLRPLAQRNRTAANQLMFQSLELRERFNPTTFASLP